LTNVKSILVLLESRFFLWDALQNTHGLSRKAMQDLYRILSVKPRREVFGIITPTVSDKHPVLTFPLPSLLFYPHFFTDPPLFFSLIPFVAIPTHRPVTTDVF
jgi:hypothetical protein